MNNVIQ